MQRCLKTTYKNAGGSSEALSYWEETFLCANYIVTHTLQCIFSLRILDSEKNICHLKAFHKLFTLSDFFKVTTFKKKSSFDWDTAVKTIQTSYYPLTA